MKRWILAGGIAVVAAVVVTLVWFQPQKLFIDDTVSEAAPSQVPAASAGTKVLRGDFESLAHETTGRAVVHEASDGARTLRLEDFETSNGPDVRVYLSAGEPYGKDFVDLGGLKGNVGDQNYEIGSKVDLDRHGTVVIWCRRFTVAFGAAQLS